MKTYSKATTLTSLAMLKIRLDTKHDYLDYLVPFVLHVLSLNPAEPITEQSVGLALQNEFGLILPLRAIQLVLRRLVRGHQLRLDHGLFHVVAELPKTKIPEERDIARNQIGSVISSLREYVKSSYQITWTEEEATITLLQFISLFSIECISYFVRGTALPDLPPGDKSARYLVGSFIKHAHDVNATLFNNIMLLVKGNMLANALICPDLAALSKSLCNDAFYLDTSLILSILGLHGKSALESAKELTQLLKNLGARLTIFEHTRLEIINVLEWAIENIHNPSAMSPVIAAIRRESKTTSDLILIRGRLENRLENLNIALKPTPRLDKAFLIDQSALKSAIEHEVRYANPRALEHDINSIQSIYFLRRGKRPSKVEDAAAIFVTPNSLLAKAAYDYGKKCESEGEISSVITDYSLANIAWLKAPLGAPNLPEKELIAMCFAVLNPEPSFWDSFIREIDRLKDAGEISPQDHEALRCSIITRDELMGVTLGDEKALTPMTVSEILARVKSELAKEHIEKFEKEKADHIKTKEERDQLLTEKQERLKHIHWKAANYARRIGQFIKILFALALFLPPILSYVFTGSLLKAALASIISIILFGINFIGAIWGLSAKDISNWTSDRLEPILRRFLIKKYMGDLKKSQ